MYRKHFLWLIFLAIGGVVMWFVVERDLRRKCYTGRFPVFDLFKGRGS